MKPQPDLLTPVPHRRSAVLLRYALLSLCGCGAALARLPEPCNIYFGAAIGPYGMTLTGGANAVIARVNGRECARYAIGGYIASNVNYVLRVPLDDGLDLRYDDQAARLGEQPIFSVLYQGVELPADDFPPLIGPRTTLQRFTIEAVPEPLCACALVAVFMASMARRKS